MRNCDINKNIANERLWGLIILGLSFTLRLLSMGNRDLDLDEAFSFFMASEHSFTDLLSPFSAAIVKDAHPPLYYLLTKIWVHSGYVFLKDAFSNPELAFRFPFAVLGTITTFIIYRAGKYHGNKILGLLLGAFHCINSFSIQITHQARMYPIIELLSAAILYQWLDLKYRLTWKGCITLAVLSSLIVLTHYGAIFYIIVIWSTILCSYPRQLIKPVISILLSVISVLWWCPAFRAQLGREASVSLFMPTTGLIIPFTIFHFFTGDRSLLLGSISQLKHHILPIGLFLIAGFLFFRMFLREISKSELKWAGTICVAPILMNWIATFRIHRVFNATHYTIYSLPAFLLLLSLVVYHQFKKKKGTVLTAVLLMLVVNGISTYRFYSNTLVPYEPWKKTCFLLKSEMPRRVYIYPAYLSVLLKFYGQEISIVGLPQRCEDMDVSQIRGGGSEKGKTGKVFLIISHDKREGRCYQALFKKSFHQKPTEFFYNNIRILLFNIEQTKRLAYGYY